MSSYSGDNLGCGACGEDRPAEIECVNCSDFDGERVVYCRPCAAWCNHSHTELAATTEQRACREEKMLASEWDDWDDLLNPTPCVRWRCVGCWTDVLIALEWPVVSPLASRLQDWWMDL